MLRWAGLNLLAGSVSGSAIAQTVEFTARKAEVDLEQRCAELDGDVEVKSGSLRLRAPRLKIEETADGVGVEGPGRLSGCSCPAPPLELGFERAEISRDGDVDLSGPRLTSGDTTLLYLPRLMLRGPNSAGMLPPTVGYSGRDGAFLGVAAELPLVSSAGQERPGTTRVRLGVGAYSRLERIADGARVSLDVSGPSGRSALAWESLDGGMVDIDAHGASGVVSYRADAARGRRALVGPLAFSRVIAPQDRARLAFASWSPAGSAYAQIRGDSARGLPGIDGAELGASSGYAVDVWETDVAGLSWEGDLLGVGGATQPGLGVFRQAMAL
ncbi:MAG: hypothetical protein KC766_38840, partial [Myxococcales bacterium]|nr:hypothetical protein [Myxococcales bacterium]